MVQENRLRKVLVIGGATATGKSDLAVAIAKRLNGEVVSFDAFTVYKGLNVGTAKLAEKDMQGVKHHLLSVVEPFKAFSAQEYRDLASSTIDDIFSRGKTPILCGGTGFYLQSVLFDSSLGNAAPNESIRKKYEDISEKFGKEYLHGLLEKVDKPSADEIHFNNVKRVIRALEIYETTGKRKSELADGFTPKYAYDAYGIHYEKSVLTERIKKRTENMFSGGLIEEVQGLLDSGVPKTAQSMQAIGYKEVIEYLEGKCDLPSLKSTIVLRTTQYAKRQETFFKRIPNFIFLEPDMPKNLTEKILRGF